jgi:hypothetical protein
MARKSFVGRLAMLALGSLAMSLMLSAAARAECIDDLKKLTDKRVGFLSEINTMAAESKRTKKPMDPAAICGKARALTSAEIALIAYMEKNKDWCSIPDTVVQSLKEAHAKSTDFGNKACVAAAQFKKMQEQQAAGAGPAAPPPLPAGPL